MVSRLVHRSANPRDSSGIYVYGNDTVRILDEAGEAWLDPLYRVLAHLFVHQVHHRGQVHDLLSQTAVAPPQLDEFFLSQDASRRAEEMTALALSEPAGVGRP